ncbi:MAG: transposase [Candidatus Thiodiazotropha sp. (ex Codakia orbicularis)]|nr:transposase [Candidatus Thiodiazotropha sp. (ex Codakia orbicularis)]
MTRARETLVSLEATPYYHCISRCVRRAWLCGQDPYTGQSFEHRRQWVLDRLQELVDIFAIDVCAYAIMSNHYHIVLHVDADKAKGLTDQQVIEQWNRLYKGHMLADRYLAGEVMSRAEWEALSELIEKWRLRLYDISWFMLCLNEHLALQANAEDNCKGRFWEGRFKSQALLDEGALLTCMSYVDLNPIRAGLAETPERSDFTSAQERIEAYAKRRSENKAKLPKRQPTKLHPFKNGREKGSVRCIDFELNDYLRLVDWTGRAIREDKKGAIPSELAPILERIGLNPDAWLTSVRHYNRNYFSVLGAIDRIKAYAQTQKKSWHRGQRAVLRSYRLVMA